MNALQYILDGHTKHFTVDEWESHKALKNTSALLIGSLDRLRSKYGRPIYPSRHPDGWARYTGSTSSQHYAVGRLSIAGDVFPACDVLDCWMAAVGMPEFGGIGLYLNTKLSEQQPGAMMHLDRRSGERMFWIRDEQGKYTYLHRDPDRFWDTLPRVRERQWKA